MGRGKRREAIDRLPWRPCPLIWGLSTRPPVAKGRGPVGPLRDEGDASAPMVATPIHIFSKRARKGIDRCWTYDSHGSGTFGIDAIGVQRVPRWVKGQEKSQKVVGS